VIITAARRSEWASAFAFRSARSMFPSSSHFTTCTFIPAMTAEAGFVPWAEEGMRQTSRCASPRSRCQARITRSPVYSPWAPELGCRETAGSPEISASQTSRSRITCWYPRACSGGAKGCTRPNSGQLTAIISAAALSFMVQEPRGIMLVFRERSRPLQASHVPHHLRLGAVPVEDGVVQVGEVRASPWGRRAFPRLPEEASGRGRSSPAG
jgi:hypothetical protein